MDIKMIKENLSIILKMKPSDIEENLHFFYDLGYTEEDYKDLIIQLKSIFGLPFDKGGYVTVRDIIDYIQKEGCRSDSPITNESEE